MTKRVKTVYNTGEISHLFANKVVTYATNPQRNFYFEDETIYSYGRHFAIAAHDPKNENVVFLTTRKYSNTTAGQISDVRSAVSHKTVIYCANPDDARRNFHINNLHNFVNRAKDAAKGLDTARKPEKYIQAIRYVYSQYETYCKHFKLNPKTAAKSPYLTIATKSDFIECENKLREETIKRAKKEQRERAKKYKIQVSEFYNFERSRLDYSAPNDETLLRYNKETERIETSKRIEIPTEIARRFWVWLQTKRTEGCEGDCNMTILHYSVTLVTSEFFTVGCHKIYFTEAQKIANLLNW